MFRRKINHKEWEHRVLRLKVKDLKESVKTIEKVKITKEVQQWLKRKERGWSENLDEDTLQKQIENTINSQEKELSDLAKEIAILQNQIAQKKKEMKLYDKEIQLLNIDVSEKNVMRDVDFERDQLRSAKERMNVILDRARIVRTIQQQHSHLLQLSTLLELQRLKTFPTLNVKNI
jgi:chromosome segregation ATPase